MRPGGSGSSLKVHGRTRTSFAFTASRSMCFSVASSRLTVPAAASAFVRARL